MSVFKFTYASYPYSGFYKQNMYKFVLCVLEFGLHYNVLSDTTMSPKIQIKHTNYNLYQIWGRIKYEAEYIYS